jgi:ATP-dependent Lon protease
MKTIQEELGGVSQENGGDACKIKTKKWDEKTQKNFEKNCQNASYESLILDSKKLFELLLELPWNEYSKDNDLKKSTKILDRDHFDLKR